MTRDQWRVIRDALEQDIIDGVLEPGARLLTEPELSQRYDAGRHSVRRAVAELAKEGYLSVEQGRGTYVQSRPLIKYAIGKRTRLRRNLKNLGIEVYGKALSIERLAANPKIAERLNIALGDPVIASRRLSLADGVPVSCGDISHSAERFPDFPERREVFGSVSAVYESYGIDDYVRASTELRARPARTDEAKLLRQHLEMPVIEVRAVDASLDGAPIAYSEVIWSAARVKFSFAGD